jgi:hypothetical protein
MIFGESNNLQPTPSDYQGQTGWFQVPRGFYCKPNPTCIEELICSPHADYSSPVYYATLHQSGQFYVFQDLWLSMLYRTTGNNNGQPNGI